MASYVVTHDGTVIMNRAIVRGTVFAENGQFKGKVFATDGTFRGAVYAKEGEFTGEVTATSGSFSNVTATKLSVTDSTFEGHINATSGSFNGVVKSNMFYSSVKVIDKNEYTINPEIEPYSNFYVIEPNDYTYITLPSAKDYDGLEIKVFTLQKVFNFEKRTILSPSNNDKLFAKQNLKSLDSSTVIENHIATSVELSGDDGFMTLNPNEDYLLKSVNGAWYVLQGGWTGE
jgi:hypothetical protein